MWQCGGIWAMPRIFCLIWTILVGVSPVQGESLVFPVQQSQTRFLSRCDAAGFVRTLQCLPLTKLIIPARGPCLLLRPFIPRQRDSCEEIPARRFLRADQSVRRSVCAVYGGNGPVASGLACLRHGLAVIMRRGWINRCNVPMLAHKKRRYRQPVRY